ncbi:Hypothetical predicted protein [Marmota monax]|uniref:Uncharacterized protein n=1 Tax=Marmota monax TaxID=9995 RepID=A0A5E4D5H5_MARMO|nr:Hypothetical predicted protein [Marmota monax]
MAVLLMRARHRPVRPSDRGVRQVHTQGGGLLPARRGSGSGRRRQREPSPVPSSRKGRRLRLCE